MPAPKSSVVDYWNRRAPGLEHSVVGEPNRFVSFGAWESPELVHAWKAGAEFRECMAHVLQYVDDLRPAELDVVVSAARGRSTLSAASLATSPRG